jgi:hypothetical protein
MTAKTINFSGLLYYNPVSNGFNPIVEATMTGPTSIDEGATATFDVAAWGIPDGPVYWWVTNLTNLTTDRISPGIFAEATIDNNRSSFSVTVNANNTTATGAQSYIVKFGKVNGTALATTIVTVNDTSQSVGSVKTIRLDPQNNNGSNLILNIADDSETNATLSGTTYSIANVQSGTVTLSSIDARLVLPAKSVKTVTMWIRFLDNPVSATRYLIDSRVTSSGNYLYTGGVSGWTSYSVNGAAISTVDVNTFDTLASVVNTWQFVTLTIETTETNPITLLNRYTTSEGAAPVQIGVVEAYDYVLNNTQIATAYQSDKSRYDPPAVGALQITTNYFSQGGVSPNNRAFLDGVPSTQWAGIRAASSFTLNKSGAYYSMTYVSDNNTGSFEFNVGTNSLSQGDSFWYVP